jgi:bifunctional non-homologous end joining protein LigD
MLFKPGSFPLGSGYSYELKWDGFRAIVSTEDGLRVRTRRGREIGPQLPEFEALPTGASARPKFVDREHAELGAGALGDVLPGHEVRVVLELGDDDEVTGRRLFSPHA